MSEFFFIPFVEHTYMQRAAAAGLAVSVGCAPLGVFLLLRRLSLVADALSHALLPGIAVGFFIAGFSVPAMLIGGIASGLVAMMIAALISRATVLREEASLAVLYLSSLAIGFMLISSLGFESHGEAAAEHHEHSEAPVSHQQQVQAEDAHAGEGIDLEHILFGAIFEIDSVGLLLLAAAVTMSLFAIAAFYRPLVIQCVDPVFLCQASRSSLLMHMIFIVLIVVNLACAAQALGTLMAIGMMVLPAAAARFWIRAVGDMIWVAVFIAIVSNIAGLLVSFHLDLPGGASIVLCAVVAYALSVVFGREEGLLVRYLPRRHLTV